MNSEQLHVGMIASSLTGAAGGIHEAMRGQSSALLRAGCQVSWLGPMQPGAAVPLGGESIRFVFSRVIGPPRFALSTDLFEKVCETRPDVLHLHGLWMLPSLTALRWGRLTKRPVIISPHGMLDSWAIANRSWKKRLALLAFERANLHEAACIHALNMAEVEAIRENGFTNPIALIPNGVDQIEQSKKVPTGDVRELLFLGRLHPKKGLAETLRAWRRLGEIDPVLSAGWRLVIAGWDDGGHEASLRRLAVELGIEKRVEFSGPLFGPDKDRAFSRASAFILASHSEGQPMAVLEAWSHGVPVYMTEGCNLPEGFACNAAIRIENDPFEIAATLAQTLGSLDLNKIGGNGRNLVSQRFCWDTVARDYLATCEWLLGRADRPACIVDSEIQGKNGKENWLETSASM